LNIIIYPRKKISSIIKQIRQKSHTKVISNQVQGLRVIRDLIIQTSEIKPIKDEIFINFTKVFIAF